MADVATAPTMTAAQLRAAGTRLLGFYLGGGGAKVDALADSAHFITKNGDTFEGLRPTDGDVLDIGKVGGARLRVFASDTAIGLLNVGGAGAGRDGLFIVDGGVSFDINASEIGRFTSTGLGVGVVAPAHRLDVRGGSGVTVSILNTGDANRGGTLSASGSGGAGALSIGTTSSGYQINFSIDGVAAWIIDTNKNILPAADNANILGFSSLRVQNIYLANAPIVTSDEREKTWRGGLNEAELRAAKRIIAELGFYQWNDAIAKKGKNGARYHFGVRAQRVWSIMADEGLVDPIAGIGHNQRPGKTPYAFLCWDGWDEKLEPEMEGWRPSKVLGADGKPKMVKCRGNEVATEQRPTGAMRVTLEAGDRFGLNLDELILFLIAAQAARIAALEGAA